MLPPISSRICYLPAADPVLSIWLNQMKVSELQLAADRSSVSARESHILTSSLLSLPLCTAYNDPFMLCSCRCYLFVANVARKEESAKKTKIHWHKREGMRSLSETPPWIIPWAFASYSASCLPDSENANAYPSKSSAHSLKVESDDVIL